MIRVLAERTGITVITATITSTFVEAARQRAEGPAHDMLSAKLDQISRRLDSIEAEITNGG